jgi:hypothetical protein
MKKRVFTNIYNPLYTGFDRFIICQGNLYLDQEKTISNLSIHDSENHLLPLTAFVDIDENLYIQEKPENNNEEFHVKFLNLDYQRYSAAQTCLYDTYEDALNVAQRILASDYHKGLERYVYGRIAVPVTFRKLSSNEIPFAEKSATIRIQNSLKEERFFEKNS